MAAPAKRMSIAVCALAAVLIDVLIDKLPALRLTEAVKDRLFGHAKAIALQSELEG